MTRRPLTPKRRQRPRAPNGLTATARQHNVSYATLRKLTDRGTPLDAAITHCRANGLTFIERGGKRPGY